MVEFKCRQCGADMVVSEVPEGRMAECPECKTFISVPAAAQKRSARRRNWLMPVAAIGGLLAILAAGHAASRFGPERWRIDAQGKAAYAALAELEILRDGMSEDEYRRCVNRARLAVLPYWESDNAKSCPAFAGWIGKAMQQYWLVEIHWPPPSEFWGTEYYRKRLLDAEYQSTLARAYLRNAKCVLDNTPDKAVSESEIKAMTDKFCADIGTSKGR